MTAAGVELLPQEEEKAVDAEATHGSDAVAAAIASESTETSGGFATGSTDAMRLPSSSISAGSLADALEPEPADADMIETVDVGEPLEPIETTQIASGEDIAAGAPIDDGLPIESGEPIAGGVPIAMHDVDGESSVSGVLIGPGSPQPMGYEASATVTAGADAATGDATFGQPTALLQGPLLAVLQAEARPADEAESAEAAQTSDVPFEDDNSGQLPHAFAAQPSEMSEVPTEVDESLRDEHVSASYPRPSEAGAGTFEPPAEQPARPRSRSSTAEMRAVTSMPDFPRSAIRSYVRDLGRYFANGTLARKLALLSIPLLPLVILVIIVAATRGPEPLQMRWVTSPAAMWSGPAAQRGYAQVDTLARGEEVVALREVYGEYALVRDTWGRVGYVNRESLVDTKPPVTPESAFPGCRQAPIETDKEPCEARARALHDACGATCTADARCMQRCQDRFAECIDGCKTRLTVPQAVAAAPTPDPVVDMAEPTPPQTPPEDVVDANDPTKAVVADKPAKPVTKKGTRPPKKPAKKPETKKKR